MPNGQKRSTHTAVAQNKRMLARVRAEKIEEALKQQEADLLRRVGDLPTKAQIQRRDKYSKLLARRFKYYHDQIFITRYPDELQLDPYPRSGKEDIVLRDKFRALIRQREKKSDILMRDQDSDEVALEKLGLGRADRCDGEVWLRDKKFDEDFTELVGGMFHPRECSNAPPIEKQREEAFWIAKYLTEFPPKVGEEDGDIRINQDTGTIYLDLDFRRAPVFSGIDWWLGPITDKTYHLVVYNANGARDTTAGKTMSKRYKTGKDEFRPLFLLSDGQQQTEWYPKPRTPCNPENLRWRMKQVVTTSDPEVKLEGW